MRGGRQYMRFGLEKIDDIVKKIYEKELPYADSVVIGDNSSGKTMLLKLFIERVESHENIYFIDAVNRGFDVKKLSKIKEKPEYKKTILETRLRETYFNLLDSFNCYGTLTERIEMLYLLYEKEVQSLFYELTNDKFEVIYGDMRGEVDFEEGRGLLSSGYQAIIRILLELIYYQDMAVEKRQMQYAWIVIDELDEFLSPRYSANFLQFLRRKFPWGKWLITTHSCDLVAHTQDANLVVLENGSCEVIDINDYSSVSEVQIIFGRLFSVLPNEEPQSNIILRRLLNNKMNHAWGQSDEECLKQIEKQDLTASQKIIINEIRKW